MRGTPNFGRENELAVWLLLALCVRKMELLSAALGSVRSRPGVWTLTKTTPRPAHRSASRWPNRCSPGCAGPKVLSFSKAYVFPARRLVHRRLGALRKNRFQHVGPDTLNVALRRLQLANIEHFTVRHAQDGSRTFAGMGVDRFVAERSLNHKAGQRRGIYDRHDYFAERHTALSAWAAALAKVEPFESRRKSARGLRRAAILAPWP